MKVCDTACSPLEWLSAISIDWPEYSVLRKSGETDSHHSYGSVELWSQCIWRLFTFSIIRFFSAQAFLDYALRIIPPKMFRIQKDLELFNLYPGVQSRWPSESHLQVGLTSIRRMDTEGKKNMFFWWMWEGRARLCLSPVLWLLSPRPCWLLSQDHIEVLTHSIAAWNLRMFLLLVCARTRLTVLFEMSFYQNWLSWCY